MLKTKKIIAISVLAVMSVCSLMSCSDKSSSSSQNYSVLVTEATTESLDNSGLDNNDPDNIGSGNNTSDNDALAGLPCRADVEAIFESWDISTPELVLAWQYPQEYLEVLANNDPDEFQSLYEEASELSTEQTKRTAQYEEEFSAPITYETTATGYEKLESEDLKFVEENYAECMSLSDLNRRR